MHRRPPWFVRSMLVAGVLAISTAAVLVRKCEAPSLVVAAWRLALASAVLVPVEVARSGRPPRGRDLARCGLAGVFLAAHFAAWIASLRYTSVASSVVLVTTNPLFVALLSWAVLGERPDRRTAAGTALGVAGAVVIAGGDLAGGSRSLVGNGLALAGAAAMSAYLVAGRSARARLGTRAYATWVYAVAAGVLLLCVAAIGLPLGPYPASTYGYLVLLALVPQLVGHTAINWSLAHLTAPTVAVVILGEPVGASLLAWAVLGEAPTASTAAGAALILAGIALALSRPGGGPSHASIP